MTSSPHLKRPFPERNGPIRNPMSARTQVQAESGAARDPMGSVSAAVFGAVENGVRTAYAVIDEYIRRGQDTARAMFNDPYRRGPMNDERGNFGGGYNPWNPMTMFTEQWMMAMRMWSQAWASFVPGGWQQGGLNPFAFYPGAVPSISVSVSSAAPVEVSLNLYPNLDMSGLVAEPLRADESALPAIEPPLIVREPASVKASLTIGANQPKGRYRGLIRKEIDKAVAGEFTVIIS